MIGERTSHLAQVLRNGLLGNWESAFPTLGVGRLLCATTRCNNNIQVSKLARMSAVTALCYRTRVSDPDAKLREFLKRVFGPGNEPELVQETEWSYVYKSGEKSYARVSKFFLDETYSIRAPEIRARWPSMSENERLDFVSNFWIKSNWSENDTEILEVIMNDGSDRLWESCAQAFLKHSDRERAVTFLIERLEQFDTERHPLNYIQALGMSKDRRALPAIRPYFEAYRKGVEAEKVSGIPEDVFFGPIPYHPYFVSAEALWKIDGSAAYEQAIRDYFHHPHEQVRYWAEHALGIEGATTENRNAEYKKKISKE
jgi:hypothetical protein